MRWDTGKGEFDLRCPQQFVSMDLKVEARGLARRYFAGLPPGAQRQELALTRGATIAGGVLRSGKPGRNMTLWAMRANRSFGNPVPIRSLARLFLDATSQFLPATFKGCTAKRETRSWVTDCQLISLKRLRPAGTRWQSFEH
jgi:hypothetical protein